MSQLNRPFYIAILDDHRDENLSDAGEKKAQLLSTNTFCHNILSTSTVIYSPSTGNRDKIFIDFYQRVQLSGEYRKNHEVCE